MFTRTAQHSAFFGDIADDTTGILDAYYHALTSVKGRIDTMVAKIEAGPLFVDDKWVVLIKPEQTNAERIKVLRTAQTAFQEQLNPLITELGKADSDAVGKLQLINYRYSDVRFDPTDPNLHPRPDDGVPDPQYEGGRQAQEMIQQQDAALTVAYVTEEDKDGSHVKTITMQDGSKQVATTTASYQPPPGTDPRKFEIQSLHPRPGDSVQTVDTYDAAGNRTSTVRTIKNSRDEVVQTDFSAPGQMYLQLKPDGTGGAMALMAGPDGQFIDVPKDSPFFTHPSITTVGGAITGLETATGGKGLDGMRMVLDEDQLAKVSAGAKYAGPGLGIATTLWDMAAAETARDACVAGVSGTVGTVGSVAVGTAFGMGGGPVGTVSSVVGSMAGAWVFGSLGSRLGEAVC
ncbi:hypothetical protein [Nocardia flavorosea]|uniref:Uncharacterized protein n=1 Tax=Nocardia flavorosea TaxID=53429 RepID=A0A846YN36_9NOCA|nr:hypothetical protein [Nocardia flavorosea]NKY60527.1 hypothetical protein [Nocardia flavorosea]